jgi:hypothetical protein
MALDLDIGGSSASWNNADATVGLSCNQQPARGPSVWYRVTGTGDILNLSMCDFSRQLDSGFNLFYAGTVGTCGNLACMGGRYTQGTSCAFDQAGTKVSFQSDPGVVYYVEVVSYSSEQGFDQNQAGTNGFVRIASASA